MFVPNSLRSAIGRERKSLHADEHTAAVYGLQINYFYRIDTFYNNFLFDNCKQKGDTERMRTKWKPLEWEDEPERRDDAMDAVLIDAMLVEVERTARLEERERIKLRLIDVMAARPWVVGDTWESIMRCVEEG